MKFEVEVGVEVEVEVDVEVEIEVEAEVEVELGGVVVVVVEVEVVVEPGIENTEKEIEEKNSPKEIKVKKVNRKRSKKKNIIVTEENSEYIPQSLRKNFKKEIKNDYIPQSQRED